MALIWDEASFGTGFADIDSQHKQLFEHINSILELSVLGAETDKVSEVLEFIDYYIHSHFRYEEELMEKNKTPIRFANKKAHEHFINEFEYLKQDFKKHGASPEFVIKTQALLVDWFKNHIIKIDTCLKESCKSGPTENASSGEYSI